MLIIPIGAAGGCFAALLPRNLAVLPFLAVAAFAFVPFLKPIIGPLPSNFSGKWNGDICLQSTPSTCGPASVATILNSLGVETNESELARDSYSYTGGTEAWYLIRAIRARGCEASVQFRPDFDPQISLPAVVGVRLGGPDGFGHFVPFLSKSGDTYSLGDPLVGPQFETLSQLRKRYHFTGFHLPISKVK